MTVTEHSNDVVKYGIVGAGLMGQEHIENLLHIDDVLITCIADPHGPSIDKCQELLLAGSPPMAAAVKIFSTARELFEADLCDLAIISTPNYTHHEVMMNAYRYGNPKLHILVEKPLCTTIEHCREVIEVSKSHEGLSFVGLEYSYMPPIKRVITDTEAGRIGSVRMVAIRDHRYPFLRKVDNWNRFTANTGGTFVEKCCHFFDLFNRIVRPSVPISVMASGAQDVNHLDEVYDGKTSDILDNGYVIVEYSEGKRACLDLCMFAEASKSQEEVSVVGEKGKLEAFLPQLEVRTGIRGKHGCGAVRVETADDERIKYRGHHYGSSFLEHLDILKAVRAVKNGASAGVATADLNGGLLSVAIGKAAHISIAEKRIVQMSELLTEEELSRPI